MNPEWIYLLKVNAGIVLFYSFYKLICQRDTFSNGAGLLCSASWVFHCFIHCLTSNIG